MAERVRIECCGIDNVKPPVLRLFVLVPAKNGKAFRRFQPGQGARIHVEWLPRLPYRTARPVDQAQRVVPVENRVGFACNRARVRRGPLALGDARRQQEPAVRRGPHACVASRREDRHPAGPYAEFDQVACGPVCRTVAARADSFGRSRPLARPCPVPRLPEEGTGCGTISHFRTRKHVIANRHHERVLRCPDQMRIPVLCPDIPVPDVRHGIEPDAAGLAGAARHQPEAAAFVLEDDNMRAAGREAHQETGGARIETWLQGGRGAIVHRLDPELVSAEAIGPHPVGIIRKLVVGRHQIVGQPVPVRRKLRCADTFRSEDILQPEIVALDRRGICAQSPCPSDQAHGDRGDENTPGPEPAVAAEFWGAAAGDIATGPGRASRRSCAVRARQTARAARHWRGRTR